MKRFAESSWFYFFLVVVGVAAICVLGEGPMKSLFGHFWKIRYTRRYTVRSKLAVSD